MPIQLPDLDNKTFSDLIQEMTASIPKYTQEWTNFNPSDPGITILEYLAWIAESLIYRANQVPEASYLNFLRLITGSNVVSDPTDQAYCRITELLTGCENGGIQDPELLKVEVQRFLQSRYRAVTWEDFRDLTLEAAPEQIKRAEVTAIEDNKIEIIIIPEKQFLAEADHLIKKVRNYLGPRKIVATTLVIKMAKYTPIKLKVVLVRKTRAALTTSVLKATVQATLSLYLDSIKGGPDGDGWPYNRSLVVYELFYILERIDGVADVEEIFAQDPSSGSTSWERFTAIPITGLINLTEPPEIEVKEAQDE